MTNTQAQPVPRGAVVLAVATGAASSWAGLHVGLETAKLGFAASISHTPGTTTRHTGPWAWGWVALAPSVTDTAWQAACELELTQRAPVADRHHGCVKADVARGQHGSGGYFLDVPNRTQGECKSCVA